ncbi:hypothetical protein E3N88_07859 [Mikania micrantha]|uniref:Uncharacterized protein n=1 Tax=Mikania micrantha TaxID=192012 RepID=A0A5N6PEQ0_9ASTR|nr:hypothetical protein E3N88_07859 [Mikania micrantha]
MVNSYYPLVVGGLAWNVPHCHGGGEGLRPGWSRRKRLHGQRRIEGRGAILCGGCPRRRLRLPEVVVAIGGGEEIGGGCAAVVGVAVVAGEDEWEGHIETLVSKVDTASRKVSLEDHNCFGIDGGHQSKEEDP